MRDCARDSGDTVGIEMDGWSCTYRQLDLYVDRMVIQMDRLGIRRGTHVGIWGINSVEWVVTFLAAARIGAVPILFNSLNTQREMKAVLNYSEVEYLYYGKGNKGIDYEQVIADIVLDVPFVKYYLPLNEGEFAFFDSRLSNEEKRKVKYLESQVSEEDTACMIFTSGTTSESKAVMLTHYNVVNNAVAMAEAMRWERGDKMCLTVPLFHCFGITASLLPCILYGMTMHLIASFRTKKIWEAISSGCNVMNGVPSMFMALSSKDEYKDISTDGLKSGIIAGSPVSVTEYKAICERFPGMHIQPAYGQTESSPCITIADWDSSFEKKASTVGRVLPHEEVRIAHTETGKILEDGVDGEIQVRGYNVMKGYYNRPKETKKTFTKDGWLRTGDIGHVDKDGDLVITGRLKEIIIRSGENIAPKEVEAEIRTIKWVKDVKVIGIPSPVTQEAVTACLIVKNGKEADVEEMLEYLEGRLAHYKIPEHVLFFDEFPMNASGKIQLAKLKNMVIEKLRRN